MFKGTMYITHDPNLCLSNMNMCRTIVIADEPDKFVLPESIKVGGSILLPPYESMVHMIDGDEMDFINSYFYYLDTNSSARKMIDIILVALIYGTNIIILMDNDGPNLDKYIVDYFMRNFGISIGDSTREFTYNKYNIPYILNRLYIEDNIDKDFFIQNYPVEVQFDINVLNKLAYDLGFVNITPELLNNISISLKNRSTNIINNVIVKR